MTRDPGEPMSQDAPEPTSDEAGALRAELECVVLSPRSGVPRSPRPPVEIYLGTEPAQYRANRVFAWSIEQVRDPGREVRIHVMSELPGFDRRFWTTGFTNYRFAVPALAAGRGRAIYNDEDQIYRTDPGELFDLDMQGAGQLSISDTESSVMLIDCERMASVWTLDEARRGWKRDLLRKASKASGLRGALDPGWNARDEEYRPGESHLIHYTTLHTQPWRPFPERFVYQKGSYTDLWHALEREALEAGFELFHRDAPSKGFEARLEVLRGLPESDLGSAIELTRELADGVEEWIRKTKAASVLELQPDLRGTVERRPGRFGLELERRCGLLEHLAEREADAEDGVVCLDGFEGVPAWDVPWLVESLFERAKRFVFLAVRCPEESPRRRFLYPPAGTTHTPDWWRSHLEAASVRHPEIGWTLVTSRGAGFEPGRIHFAQGGPRPDDTPPRVWTLSDGEPGNATQVAALAEALGWPAERLEPGLRASAALPFQGQGAHLRTLDSESRAMLEAAQQWPELLIVAGRRVAPVARWIREQARGRTRVVALGERAATPPEAVDLAVTPRGALVFPHPNRFEIDRPLVRPQPSIGAGNRWRERIQAIPGPRLVVAVGSGTDRLGIDAREAESLGRLVAESAVGLGASVLVSASRHARRPVLEACLRGLGRTAFVQRVSRSQRDEELAWPVLLDEGDLFVMIGLGEVALTELSRTGKPLFLAPQHGRPQQLGSRLRDGFAAAVAERAEARPANDRGTTRPQEGLELICARWVARGWVRPRRDVEALRGRLVRNGRARLLRAPIRAGDLAGFVAPLPPESPRVAERVRALLGATPRPPSE